MKNWAIDITIEIEAPTSIEAWKKANDIAGILAEKDIDIVEVSEPEQI
jgi:hypothetical protein